MLIFTCVTNRGPTLVYPTFIFYQNFFNIRSDMPNKPKEPYDASKLQQAIDAVQNKGWSINRCSKLFSVPRTTL